MRPTLPWPVVCLLGCVVAIAGCHVLSREAASLRGLTQTADDDLPTLLAPSGTKPDPLTIPLDLVFVRYQENDAELGSELWTFVDEQAWGGDVARHLNANGLRAGIVTGHLPPHLAARFQMPSEAGPATAEPPVSQRLLRLLPGRRSDVVAVANLPELVLLEERDGRMHGGTFHDATGMFALVVQPAADGRVDLSLTPEIKHGPLERAWVGEDGMFRVEARQKRHRRDDLEMSRALPADALVIVACCGPRGSTLGDALFRDAQGDGTTLRLLAIRPRARTVDPMFGTPEAPADAGATGVMEIR
jgi:hypothetical protein